MLDFSDHRKRLFSKMPDQSILILFSSPKRQRSADTEYVYRPSSNLYYLSGFKEPDSVLVMIKKAGQTQTTLFVHPKDPLKEMWEGASMGEEVACERLGVDQAFSIETLETRLPELLESTQHLYVDLLDLDFRLKKVLQKASQGKAAHLYPAHFSDANRLVLAQRRKKSHGEIALIKKALQLTQKAHHAAMAVSRPGTFEYQTMALVEYIFKHGGASWDAYTTIVAGGNHANTLHYIENDGRLQDGDLILMDAGCEFDYYASDITRCFPVNGRFSGTQKALYEGVLETQKRVIEAIKPGVYRTALNQIAIEGLSRTLAETKALNKSCEEIMEKALYKSYYPHGIGHWMGLDVHDPMLYKDADDVELPLEEGDVITIEPGLYLDSKDQSIAEAYRGIGIRIEDDILVTEKGHENLSIGIVKEVKDIEEKSKMTLYDYI